MEGNSNLVIALLQNFEALFFGVGGFAPLSLETSSQHATGVCI